jgi:hypothetical protein
MGLAVPNEAIIHNGDVVGGSLPFTHQNGPGPRERGCQGAGTLGCTVAQGTVEESIKLICDRLCEPAVKSFLPRIGNCERENVASEACRRFVAKFLRSERTRLSARQSIEVVDIQVTSVASGSDRPSHGLGRVSVSVLRFGFGSPCREDSIDALAAAVVGHEL